MLINEQKNNAELTALYERDRQEKSFLLKFAVSTIMVIGIIIALLVSKQANGLLFACIPLVYVVCFIFILEFYKYANTPVMMVVNVLYLVRYYILPFLTFLDTRLFYLEENYAGIILMLVEEVVGLLAFACFLPGYRYKKEMAQQKERENKIYRFSKQLYIAAFIMLCLSFFFIIIDRSVLDLYNFIFYLTSENIGELEGVETSAGTLSVIIIDVTRIIVPAAVALFFSNRYILTKFKLNYYLSIILGLALSMATIKGVDRGTVLLQGLAIVFFMAYLLPENRKQTLKLSILILFLIGAYLILIRMLEEGSSSGISGIVDYLQSYVAGIKNLNMVWLTYQYQSENITIVTAFNDFLANVPILSALADGTNTCLKYFNITYGRTGTDQVMPLMGNGLLYFGIFLAPIFNVLVIKLILIFDTAYLKSNNIMMVLTLSFASSIMGFIHYQHIQLIMLYLTCRILPLFLICYVFSKFKIKELE